MKEIKYNGLTTTPDDYECPDGDLQLGYNVAQDGGALRPLLPPKVIGTLASGATAVYIHKMSSLTNYVYCISGQAYWTPSTGVSVNSASGTSIGGVTNVVSFSSVGNTLIAVGKTSIYYLLWADGNYTLLGNRLPDLSLSFGLKGYPRSWRYSENNGDTFLTEKVTNRNSFSQEDREKITDKIMARLNSFVENESTKKGRFVFPFFVRYALRLYDGSLVCHSAPILMTPLTHGPMVVSVSDNHGEYYSFDCDVILVGATLNFQALSASQLTTLEQWQDIVKSVDVFVSAPIYTYNQSGEVTGTTTNRSGDVFQFNKFVGQLQYSSTRGASSTSIVADHVVGDVTVTDDCYAEFSFSDIYKMFFNYKRELPDSYIILPPKSFGATAARTASNRVSTSVSTDTDDTLNTIASTSTFYKLVSLQVSDISAKNRIDISVADDYLQSLTSREVMTDDYLTHDKLAASMAYNYNQRLLLSGILRTLYDGYDPHSMWPYVNMAVTVSVDTTTDGHPMIVAKDETESYYTKQTQIFVHIREDGGEYVVNNFNLEEHLDWTGSTTQSWGCYLYYPNSNAYKMVIKNGRGSYTATLTAHDFLNGAYAVLPFNASRATDSDTSYINGTSVVQVSNKVYESEANNPFYFPAKGILTVGTGNVLGIAAAVRPLSEGQFGQYPVYAFCDEGVWALEVSSTGTFAAKAPVTRDVCLSAAGICQLDQSVLFASARGIMELSGNECRCISQSLDTPSTLRLAQLTDLPYMSQILDRIHSSTGDVTMVPFKTYIQGCRIIYDYIQQHVVVFNSAYSYAYVYDLSTRTWSTMQSTLSAALNSYPQAYAINKSNQVVDLDQSPDESAYVLIVTRPLKLDAPDILKTVHACIQRGAFSEGNISSALYASRDLIDWQLVESATSPQIRSLGGTPYKYFIVVAVGEISSAEHISGCTIQEAQRLTRRLR